MEHFDYQEIFYTSSEKGIFSGNPGFGIRACTQGMAYDEADRIVSTCSPGYEVYNERVLDMERIKANPDVVYDYPPVYMYRTVQLNDGSKKYVLGRTVYLGVDYGFFKGINAYDRTGTNYFTHFFVFSKEPPVSLLGKIICEQAFAPSNYSCSPANTELQALLTGDPEFLPPKSLEFDAGQAELVCPEEAIHFLLGVTQMLKNQNLPEETDAPRKMYVKCPWKRVEEFISTLSMFAHTSSEKIHFLSNYMQGYGIPEGSDIVFVNEYNVTDLYEDNYVTVDFFNESKKNVESNFIIDRITDLIRQKELKTASQLVEFYLGLNNVPDADYEFSYFIFVGAVSDMEVRMEDLTDTFLQKLSAIRLDEDRSSRLWGKVNKTLNEGLTSTSGKDFMTAVLRYKEIRRIFPEKVQIQEATASYVTSILFNGNGNFGKIANEGNITSLLEMVDKNIIPSEELFLASLHESSIGKVWQKCLAFYYNGQFRNPAAVISAIVHASLSEQEISGLLAVTFPTDKYADTLFEYYKAHPSDIVRVKANFAALVGHYGEKRFADFVQMTQTAPELKPAVAPAIVKYYGDKINANLLLGTNALFDFLDKTGIVQITHLSLWPLLQTASKKYLKEPLKDIKTFLNKLTERNITFPKDQDGEVSLLICLVNKTAPKTADRTFTRVVFRNYPDDAAFVTQVFMAWVNNGAEKEQVGEFIADTRHRMSDEIISSVMKSIWKSTVPQVSQNKESLVLAVLDNSGWDRNKVEDFCKKTRNPELKEFVLKSSSFFSKLLRKLFK